MSYICVKKSRADVRKVTCRYVWVRSSQKYGYGSGAGERLITYPETDRVRVIFLALMLDSALRARSIQYRTELKTIYRTSVTLCGNWYSS